MSSFTAYYIGNAWNTQHIWSNMKILNYIILISYICVERGGEKLGHTYIYNKKNRNLWDVTMNVCLRNMAYLSKHLGPEPALWKNGGLKITQIIRNAITVSTQCNYSSIYLGEIIPIWLFHSY